MQNRRATVSILCFALFAITIAIYWTALSCDFVNLDDGDYVYDNACVIQGLSYYGWLYAWTSFDCSNWHPLTWLSLELDSRLWGESPVGFHATNAVIHAINAVLLFVTLNLLTLRIGRSLAVAAFFAVHPLHVESVAWISERKDVLSTFFLLVTILTYRFYAKRPSFFRYSLIVVAFASGLLSKPMLVVLPALLILLDIWPLDRIERQNGPIDEVQFPRRPILLILLEKLPLFLLALTDGIVTIIAQRNATKGVSDLTFPYQVGNAFSAYLWYLQKTFVPTDLIAFYPHPGRNLSMLSAAIGFVVVVSITLWVTLNRNSKPALFTGWIWFAFSLLPVIGLIQVGGQAHADRYSYIPHIGLFIFVVWIVTDLVGVSRPRRIVLGSIAVISFAYCVWLTHSQILVWKDSETLWAHALDVDPNNAFAHMQMASVRFSEEKYAEAISHLEKSTEQLQTRRFATPYYVWGSSLLALGRSDEAERKFDVALEIKPRHIPTLNALWKLLSERDRNEEAKKIGEQLVYAMAENSRKQPYSAMAQINLGSIEMSRGNLRVATRYFERAIQLHPRNAAAYVNLALTQISLGLSKEAKRNLTYAIELDPRQAEAHVHLGQLLEAENDTASAKSHYSEAIRVDPSNAQARERLRRLSQF